jgi:hypothetical protein
MLGCSNEQHSIDASRVHSFGFSAGAVFTSLIHSRYPKLIAAIVTESGAWMNDPEETKLVELFTIDWSWPALDPADRGDVLLTHGGPNDVTCSMCSTSRRRRRRRCRSSPPRSAPSSSAWRDPPLVEHSDPITTASGEADLPPSPAPCALFPARGSKRA